MEEKADISKFKLLSKGERKELVKNASKINEIVKDNIESKHQYSSEEKYSDVDMQPRRTEKFSIEEKSDIFKNKLDPNRATIQKKNNVNKITKSTVEDSLIEIRAEKILQGFKM